MKYLTKIVSMGLAIMMSLQISSVLVQGSVEQSDPSQWQDSPWVSSWKKGDATSSTGEYQIYPVPQQLTRLPSNTAVQLEGQVTVAVGEGVSEATKQYLQQVLQAYGITVNFVSPDQPATIYLAIQENATGIAEQFDMQSIDPFLQHQEGYMLKAADGKITILGGQAKGVFYGVATLKMMLSSMGGTTLPAVEIADYPSISLRGFVEGFYGGFTHQQRVSLMEFSQDIKMNLYVYAAKSDPYHTDRWAEPYPQEKIEEFKQLIDLQNKTGCEFSWSVHLGSFFRGLTEENYAQRKAQLIAKFDQLYEIGVRRFSILNDDFGAGSTEMVVRLINELNQEYIKPKQCLPIIYCSQNYNNAWSNANGLKEIRGLAGLDDDVMLFWTGRDVNSPFWQDSIDYVINNTKDPANPDSFQSPVFWLNYPVSEHAKSGIFLGSCKYYLKDGVTGLKGAVSNPIFFAETDKVALFQLANYFWNVNNAEANADAVWEQSFKYLQPEVYDSYLTIARNLSNAPNSTRVPGFPESEYIKDHLESVTNVIKNGRQGLETNQQAKELLAEFAHILYAVEDFEKNCNNSELVKELKNPSFLLNKEGEGWLQALSNVATSAYALLQAEQELSKANPDMSMVWSNFSKATSNMQEYAARKYSYPDGQNTPQPQAGSLRLVPFVNTIMQDVQTAIESNLGTPQSGQSRDRVYTNIAQFAKTPITIQDTIYSLKNINAVSLNQGEYIGIKTAGIAEISKVILQGENTQNLKLEWSLHGDVWHNIQSGVQDPKIVARYVRVKNVSNQAITASIKELSLQIENLEPQMKIADSNITSFKQGNWNQLIDKDLSSYVWTQKNQAKGDYVTIDTGAVQPINDVTFYSTDGKDHIYFAQVSISQDNKTFSPIGEIDDSTNSNNIQPPYRVYSFDGGGQKARYIRLENTKAPSPPAWTQLYEMQLNQKKPVDGRLPSSAVVGSNLDGLDKLIDGNLSTVYSIVAKEGEYVEYRVTDNINVKQFSILQASPCNAKVTVQYADGTSEILGNIDQQSNQFQPQKSIYSIRLDFLPQTTISINEIILSCGEDASGDVGVVVDPIFPDQRPEDSQETINLALKQPVEVSGVETASVKPENAVDGNTGTKWDSKPLKGTGAVSPQWIIVDLGSYTNQISSFTMRFFNKVYPTDYDIMVSNDKQTWVTLKNLTHENNATPYPVDTVQLEMPVQARYVKLEMRAINTAAAGNCIGLQEFEIMGKRRTVDMQYTEVETFEDVALKIGQEWSPNQLIQAKVMTENQQSIYVKVIPTWNPNTIDTSKDTEIHLKGTLPETQNLLNHQQLQAKILVMVGNPPKPTATPEPTATPQPSPTPTQSPTPTESPKPTLIPSPTVPPQPDQVRVWKESLKSVPPALQANSELNTVEKILDRMLELSKKLLPNVTAETFKVWDMKLQQVQHDGSFVDVSEENFPAEGVEVVLQYPQGTNSQSHSFFVTHMFTMDKNEKKAGEVEFPAVTLQQDGIHFRVTSLSPVGLAWAEKTTTPENGSVSSGASSQPTPPAKQNSVQTGDTFAVQTVGILCCIAGLTGLMAYYQKKKQK